MRRYRMCAVLTLVALLAAVPAFAADPGETGARRAGLAALWDRVAGSLAALWQAIVPTPDGEDEPAEPSSVPPPPPDSEPQGDAGGTLDPWG